MMRAGNVTEMTPDLSGGIQVKRRLPLTVVLTALLLVSLAGVAWAANTINCVGSSTCEGTPNADDIYGSERAEKIVAEKGPDAVQANRGPDNVVAGLGADEVDGDSGNDRISGGDGDDQRDAARSTLGTRLPGLFGDNGSDRVMGGPGADDALFGGDGNDILDSFDQQRDRVVDCGPGRDIAYVDRKDRRGKIIEDCEQITRGAAPMSAEQYRAADAELR